MECGILIGGSASSFSHQSRQAAVPDTMNDDPRSPDYHFPTQTVRGYKWRK